VRQAVDAVRALDQPAATAEALSLLHHLLLAPHDRTEREQVVRELVGVSAQTGSPQHVLKALLWSTADALLTGDRDAPRLLARLRVRADELDHAVFRYVVRVIDIMLLLRAGNIAESEALLDGVHAQGSDAGEVDATTWYAGQLLAVRWLQGRQGEMLEGARTLADSPNVNPANRAFAAVWAALAAAAGNADEARVALARVDPFGSPPLGLAPSSVWLVTMFAVVEALRDLHDARGAEHAYDLLAPFADVPIMASLAVACFGSPHRCLGWCAVVSGDTARGIRHFHRAIAHDIELGNLPMLAITRAELAGIIASSDAASACELLANAIDGATRFGMTGWLEQWTAQRAELVERAEGRERNARWCHHGHTWEIELDTTRILVAHSRGMAIIRTLLSSPYRDVPATTLAGASDTWDTSSRQPVLDARARDELRARLFELRVEIDRADARGDSGGSSRLSEEFEQITRELSHAFGRGNVSRQFSTPTERARTSVQKAIRRALTRIAEQAPDLANQLGRSIQTGASCRFEPADDLPSKWITDEARESASRL
jgi:predicted alpha/beta hydrolase family esterase